jgi:hypothetical protein
MGMGSGSTKAPAGVRWLPRSEVRIGDPRPGSAPTRLVIIKGTNFCPIVEAQSANRS